MIWNGNEIVFSEDVNKGVAGISQDMPDDLAEEMVRRWNGYGGSRKAILEIETATLYSIKKMGEESLNPDSFCDLERIIEELRYVRSAFAGSK